MLDSYKREITYLRISVTDRCNLACGYCMPEQLAAGVKRNGLLSFEEISEIVGVLAPLGITKIRLTGGEPLVRTGVDELVRMLAGINGIRELTMTTNGQLLERQAEALASAGLERVNISLDTLDPVRYRELTRGGDIRRVLKGIEAALAAGLDPVKINGVITPETTALEMSELKAFGLKMGLEVRFIRQMNLGTGRFWRVEGGEGGHCRTCNRMRLTSDGRFIPCLFSDREYSIHEYGILEAFTRAVQQKPGRGRVNSRNTFYGIGG